MGLICVDDKGYPVKHLFGKNSFDAKETFDTLIKCERCMGLDNIPDSVVLAGDVATMGKDISALKDVMKNISINVKMLNDKVFPQAPSPAPAPGPAMGPAVAKEAEPAKALVHTDSVHHRHHSRNLRHSRRHHHRREYDDDDDDEDRDDDRYYDDDDDYRRAPVERREPVAPQAAPQAPPQAAPQAPPQAAPQAVP